MSKLTDRSVAALKAPPNRTETPDDIVKGLYLVTQPSGKKSWALRYRVDGKPTKYTIGAYPKVGLGEARRLARDALVEVGVGGNPAAAKRAARHAEPTDPDLVENAIDEFMRGHAEIACRSSTIADYRRNLTQHVLPRWRGRRVQDITKSDVYKLIDELAADGLKVRQNRVLAVLRIFMNRLVERGRLSSSPLAGVKSPVKERPRDRILTDRELAAVWCSAERQAYPFGTLVQILILTGARRSEVAMMRWADIDLEAATWTIRREHAKNHRSIALPLAPLALQIIRDVPRFDDDCPYVLTTNGRSAVSGFSKPKANLDKLVKDRIGGPIPQWGLHDLRRTFVTGGAALGTPVVVLDRAINHTGQTVRGVAAVYQRYEFAKEMRVAAELWAAHVLAVSVAPASVAEA